ncbi:MAG: hypothetical protein KDE33_13870 [Bacteroidetes bacterium]|nr:hypothetical protein [Bacteroidota bacterium]
MGHWGPGILSNDTASDIKYTFYDLYDKGLEPVEIRRQVEKDFKEGDKLEDNSDLWLSLAYFQWQIGHLDKDVKEKAETLIDQDIDLKLWEDLDADLATLKKRSAALQKLRTQLQTDNPKPIHRKKKSTPKTIFKKGECYAVKLRNDNYTAVVVLEDKKDEFALNLIANTTIHQKELPTIEDIENADLLLLPPVQGLNNKKPYREGIAVYMNVRFRKIIKDFIKIGEIEIVRTYDENYLRWSSYAPWTNIAETANIFLVDKKERPTETKKMNELINQRPLTSAKSMRADSDKNNDSAIKKLWSRLTGKD